MYIEKKNEKKKKTVVCFAPRTPRLFPMSVRALLFCIFFFFFAQIVAHCLYVNFLFFLLRGFAIRQL